MGVTFCSRDREDEMELVTIRNGIHPRCDRHSFSSMQPVTIQRKTVGGELHWFPAFACTEAHCHRRYNTGFGYFSVAGGMIERNTQTMIACPQDGLPMYIDTFESGTGLRIWRCAHFGCTAHHAVRTAAQSL